MGEVAGPGLCQMFDSEVCSTCNHESYVRCKETAVGTFPVIDGYENRSYPMCLRHVRDRRQHTPGGSRVG